MYYFRNIEEIPLRPVFGSTKVFARHISGQHVMLNQVTFKPGTYVPEHQHPNEQIDYVLKGAIRVKVGSEEKVMRPGDIAVIPANTPHSFASASDEESVFIEVQSPPRLDYFPEVFITRPVHPDLSDQ